MDDVHRIVDRWGGCIARMNEPRCFSFELLVIDVAPDRDQ